MMIPNLLRGKCMEEQHKLEARSELPRPRAWNVLAGGWRTKATGVDWEKESGVDM